MVQTFFTPLGTTIPYRQNEVIFEQAGGGQVNVEIKVNGYYEITCIGAGGGGVGIGSNGTGCAGCTGAAGAGFIGTINISKGTLILNIGNGGNKDGGGDSNKTGGTGGSTSIYYGSTNIVTCGGGTGGHAWWRGSYALGIGGSVTQGSFITNVKESVKGSNGVGNGGYSAIYCTPPLNAYGYTYGNGGMAYGSPSNYYWEAGDGEPGFVLIKFLRSW